MKYEIKDLKIDIYQIKDLKIDIYQGAPNVSMGSNFVRVTHTPSGVVVQSEERVSALENQRRALQMLDDIERPAAPEGTEK